MRLILETLRYASTDPNDLMQEVPLLMRYDYVWKVWACVTPVTDPGPRLNIKTVLSTYGDFHVKDKTAVRTSYL